MVVLWVLVIAALVFGVALLALGRGDSMASVGADRVEPELPGRRLVPADLDELRLPLSLRGYRMAEVDAVLLRLRQEIADRDAELQTLRPSEPVLRGPDEASDGTGQQPN
jgi:DivIVA domain-containing protein